MKILPWSPSAIDDFVNCPRSFYGKRVLKKFPYVETPEQKYGTYVHKCFENAQSGVIVNGRASLGVLPDDLKVHQPFMQRLWDKPGMHFLEWKGGFDKKAQPCAFFAQDVWCRLVIDYIKVSEASRSGYLVDYKTGKPHQKFKQLYLYCIYVFAMFPYVDLINAQFYWTQTRDVTKKVIGRDEVPELWKHFIPDLKQYAEAFKTDTWQERPSGLCNGWCPDTECDHWKPKRTT